MPKEAKNKKPTTSKMATKKASQPANLSAEYIKDSDVESGNSDTSDDDSLPENPATNISKGDRPAKAPVVDISSSSGSDQESGSEDESGSESSSQESEDENILSRTDKKTQPADALHPRQDSKPSSTKVVSFEEPGPYAPPSGFEPVSITHDEIPRASQLLQDSNLQGKEVWYITAPASVPLSTIKEFSLQGVEEHKEILSYNGDDYAFVPDASEARAHTKIMVLSGPSNNYVAGKIPINRMLHLQQTIPRVKFTSHVTTPVKTAVRQQPRGLKMRFRPIGFDKGTTGSGLSDAESDSDEDMPDIQAPKFQKAASLSPSVDSSEAEKTILPSKAGVKSESHTAGSGKATSSSTKRKHREGDVKKSKHSKKSKDHSQ